MTRHPKRYDIYLADLNPSIGSEYEKIRPVVVISQDEMNKHLETVVVCPLTSTIHLTWRSRIQIDCAGTPSEIAIDQIRAISKQRLKKKVDRIPVESAKLLRRIITEMYGE